jgi:hypothetical protein
MEMIYCPNCAKQTGFKRALGFGTFFVALLTAGFWLLAIPFYPVRCINCGLARGSALRHDKDPSKASPNSGFVFLVILTAVGVLWLVDKGPARDPARSITKDQQHNETLASTPTATGSVSPQEPSVARAQQDAPPSVDAQTLLAAYQRDESGARATYDGRKVSITGALTGVFVPSDELILRMGTKGLSASAFVTMGGPRVRSPEESLMMPGITAYSKEGSFFGQPGPIPLIVGQVVTVACTCKSAISAQLKSAEGGPAYSVLLEDCSLAPSRPVVENAREQATGAGAPNLLEAPGFKDLALRLFGSEALSDKALFTGVERVQQFPTTSRSLSKFAVFEFHRLNDSKHGGMIVQNIESGRGEATGVLYDEQELTVYLGDYQYKQNLPMAFQMWMADENNRERTTGNIRNIRYVYPDSQ